MTSEARFIAKNEDSWKALEVLLKKRLAAEDVREFARLFRLASHHLAYAKTHYPTGSSLPYLNRLVGVAHNSFYVRERGSFSLIREYFASTFPRAVRETWRFWVAATAFFVLGILFAGFYVAGNPAELQNILPAGMADGFAPGHVPDFGDGDVDWDYPLMTAIIATNNIAVAFNAFALGLLAGLGTIYILVYNGLVAGGLFGFLHQSGADMVTAYALVLPHGVLELMAIFLCGGCGLMLGKGLLIPGDYTRKHSLITQAKRAVVLIPGIVTMLVIAAIIEGFFTPLAISPWAKLAFAALTGAGFIIYCMRRRIYHA
ncbi:MAG: stage II sporulation protein M [Defluviitaleaceae bacterium]|nr:stage II sporulation protein M [Defluviitaleaceae bacterium]